MNAKSIYDKLVNVEGIPSSILTYSDKNDCIIIEVQDYDKSVFKFAQKFFNGYKSVDIDYTNENKTSVWYNDVSEYSDRETIDSITRFYYDIKVKGLVESKKSARNSIKESLNIKDYCVEVYGDWFKEFYSDFDEFKNDLLYLSEGKNEDVLPFTYDISPYSESSYVINAENDYGDKKQIVFVLIPKPNKSIAKELNNLLH